VKEVKASIIQGSGLGPRLAKIYGNSTNEMVKRTPEDRAREFKFADDEKRVRVVREQEQRTRMQDDIDAMQLWCNKWDMTLNIDKVHVMHFGARNTRQEYYLEEGERQVVKVVQEEKDLGVLISNDLKPTKMVQRQSKKAHVQVTEMTRAFTYRNRTLLSLYTSIIRPSMLYGITTWRPTNQTDLRALEQVQRRVIRMCGDLGRGSYEEKCRKAKLLTVEETLEEEDVLQAWGIMAGNDRVDRKQFWTLKTEEEDRGRAPRARLRYQEVVRTHPNRDCRKNSFAVRTEEKWNMLPEEVKKVKTSRAFRTNYRAWAGLPEQEEEQE